MDKQLFSEMPPEKRAGHLEANCDSIEEIEYSKAYSKEEMDELKTELPNNLIEIQKEEEVLKAAKDLYKVKTKIPKEMVKEYTQSIRTGRKMINENCYKMVDTDQREVGYYNNEGELVMQRPAFPDELQKTTFQVIREGTNN
jgi:hypothetical protein